MPSPLAMPVALVNVLVLAASLAASRGALRSLLPEGGAERRALLAVLAAALLLRAAGPYRPVPWADEWYYAEQAATLAVHRLNAFCTYGRLGDCRRFAVFYPIGYPLALGLAAALLGPASIAARAVGAAAGALTAACAYLLARSLGLGHRAALAASLVVALLPLHVRYGAVMHAEVLSVLLEGMAVLAAALHARTGSRPLEWLAASSLALHVAARQENPLALMPLAVVYWRGGPARPSPLPWLGALLLAAPHLSGWGELNWEQMYTEAGMKHEGLSLRLHPRHIPSNLGYLEYWVGGYFHPLLFTALALLGGAALGRSMPGALLVAWSGSRLAVFLLHSFPSFVPRYMLTLSLPFAVACGAGAAALSAPAGLVAAAIALSGLLHLPFAYDPLYGLELAAGPRTLLAASHLALPALSLAALASWERGRARRLLASSAVACAVLAAILYPRVDRADGLPRPIREALALEERTVEGWRPLVGEGCYVAAGEPVRTRALWRRRTLSPDSHLPVPETVEGLRRDVGSLMDGGGCVFYYDALSQPDLVSGMMRSSFALERLAEAEVPPDQATASGSLQRLALYRVSRPNSCARGRACV